MLCWRLFLSVLIFITAPRLLMAEEFIVPPIQNHVTDLAGVLSPSTEGELNTTLATVKKTTGIEMAVLTIESLHGLPIEDASIQIAEQWKLGTASEDKGLLLLLSTGDRRLRFEVGQGLEGSLTDLYANRIIQKTMVPLLKGGNYDDAILLGTYEALQRAAPDLNLQNVASASYPKDVRNHKKRLSLLGNLFWILIVLIFMFGGGGRGRRGRRGLIGGIPLGGGFGGGGFGGGFGGGGGFSGGGSSGGW